MNAPGRGPLRALARLSWPLAIAVISISISAPTALAAAGSTRISNAAARRAARFWTPARMARARALAPRVGQAHRGAAAVAPRPGRPLRVAARESTATDPETVLDPTAPTYRVNGVVFFEGIFSLGRCSGTSVDAPNLSVVFTAGHCVNSGGGHGDWYSRNWIFVPAYRYGQRPYGVFPAKWLGTTSRWRFKGSENADVGVAVVGRNGRGQRLAAAVGAVGFASGLKARQVFDVHGYPAEEPFDGETLQLCAGRPLLGRDPDSLLYAGPMTLGVGCNVTGGGSGGGWTIAGGLLNSVSDYTRLGDSSTIYGAYFGKEVARLYHRAGRVR